MPRLPHLRGEQDAEPETDGSEQPPMTSGDPLATPAPDDPPKVTSGDPLAGDADPAASEDASAETPSSDDAPSEPTAAAAPASEDAPAAATSEDAPTTASEDAPSPTADASAAPTSEDAPSPDPSAAPSSKDAPRTSLWGGEQPTTEAPSVEQGEAPTSVVPPVTPGPPAVATPIATGEAAAAPAEGEQTAEQAPVDAAPRFHERARMRRRMRELRRLREIGFRDLGGLTFDLHRFGRQRRDLVDEKLQALEKVDVELRAIETALDARQPITEVREAGIASCPRCGTLHGTDANFCPGCGTPLRGSVVREAGPLRVTPADPPPS